MSYRQAERASLVAFLVATAVILAFWAGVVLIALHFISKLW